MTYLNHDNQGQERCEGEHHAGILGDGPAASAEPDHQDDDPQSDEQDGAVEVWVVQEVEVVAHLDLDVGSHRDQGHARHEQEEVEDEDEVLEHGIAAVLHDGGFWGSWWEFNKAGNVQESCNGHMCNKT